MFSSVHRPRSTTASGLRDGSVLAKARAPTPPGSFCHTHSLGLTVNVDPLNLRVDWNSICQLTPCFPGKLSSPFVTWLIPNNPFTVRPFQECGPDFSEYIRSSSKFPRHFSQWSFYLWVQDYLYPFLSLPGDCKLCKYKDNVCRWPPETVGHRCLSLTLFPHLLVIWPWENHLIPSYVKISHLYIYMVLL